MAKWLQAASDDDGSIERRVMPPVLTPEEAHIVLGGRQVRRLLREIAAINRQIAELGPEDAGTYAIMLQAREQYTAAVSAFITGQFYARRY
jgi:hypothetical protein